MHVGFSNTQAHPVNVLISLVTLLYSSDYNIKSEDFQNACPIVGPYTRWGLPRLKSLSTGTLDGSNFFPVVDYFYEKGTKKQITLIANVLNYSFQSKTNLSSLTNYFVTTLLVAIQYKKVFAFGHSSPLSFGFWSSKRNVWPPHLVSISYRKILAFICFTEKSHKIQE